VTAHVVARDRGTGNIGKKVVEQYLRGQQWQKRQPERGRGHAEHVAEIRADGRQNVLERVGERSAALVDTVAQNVQVLFQQHQVRGDLRHVDGGIHRNADIRGVQCWRVVDPIAQVTDNVPCLLKSQDNALFLMGIHLGEDGGAFGSMPECFVSHAVQLAAGQQLGDRQVHRLGDVPCHQLVVAGDDLELHAPVGEIDDRLGDIALGGIEKQQESGKLKFVLVLA